MRNKAFHLPLILSPQSRCGRGLTIKAFVMPPLSCSDTSRYGRRLTVAGTKPLNMIYTAGTCAVPSAAADTPAYFSRVNFGDRHRYARAKNN